MIDLKTPPSSKEIGLEVEAIGHQWWWEFSYPNDNIHIQTLPPNYSDLTPPKLVVPVGVTVLVRVRSLDVVHSFYIPKFYYKIQAVPGTVNLMHFKVEKPGIYIGQCVQFCGLRHSDMRFVIEALEKDDYARWLNETKRAQQRTETMPTPEVEETRKQ